LFAFGYSALQLFPSLEYSHLAYRWTGDPRPVLVSSQVPYSIAGSQWALPPEGLLLTIFPYISTVENHPYFGILPLFLCLLSLPQIRKSRVVQLAWLMALFFLVLAMGQYSPLHGVFYALVPGFDKAREASRSLLVTHGALSLLAGFGCQACFRPLQKKERVVTLRLLQVLIGFSLFITLVVFSGYFYRVQVLFQRTDYSPLFVSCLLLLMSSAVVLCRFYSLSSRRSLKAAVFLVLLFDCHYVMNNHIKLKSEFNNKTNYEPKQFYSEDDLIRFLKAQQGEFRVQFRDSYPPNIGEVYKLETINGYGATTLKHFRDFVSAETLPGDQIADLLNVRYIVSDQDLPLPEVFATTKAKVYENVDCLPRAWLASRITSKPDAASILARLLEVGFNPREEALVEEHQGLAEKSNGLSHLTPSLPSNSGADRLAAYPPRYERISPNRFIVEVETRESSFLVISQTWYPGWNATVNGQSKEVIAVNGFLMGVPLSSGTSKVEFIYRPTNFYRALSLTVLFLLILCESCRRIKKDTRGLATRAAEETNAQQRSHASQ